jgi:hypothetical protein
VTDWLPALAIGKGRHVVGMYQGMVTLTRTDDGQHQLWLYDQMQAEGDHAGRLCRLSARPLDGGLVPMTYRGWNSYASPKRLRRSEPRPAFPVRKCRIVRQGDERTCFTCARRWGAHEADPPCDLREPPLP